MSTIAECKQAEFKASGINAADWRHCAQLWRECRAPKENPDKFRADIEACDFIAEAIERGDRERAHG